MRKLKLLVLVVLSGVFIYSGVNIGMYAYDGYISSKINDRLKQQYAAALQAQQYDVDQASNNGAVNGDEASPEELLQLQKEQQKLRFKNLQEINADIVGWISIEGTQIDYPVVRHTDNDYYLNHNL